jgi:hypothetical protein
MARAITACRRLESALSDLRQDVDHPRFLLGLRQVLQESV